MFSDKHKDKCLYYARWLCVRDDGVFVRVVWQVQTDRTDAKGSGNDQWIGRARSTHLEALWVNLRNTESIAISDEVQMVWDHALELRPGIKFPIVDISEKGKGKAKDSAAMPHRDPKKRRN